ncbi:hypothetical protein WA026_005715 [Henosepilachna vigintioctopunctata]|uniref:Uncharacterized protein n=1 Tax=Henosepilachna vigintioctopunctata TaxID=420089 RepID=A0AAW1TTK9_9CUCU
MESCGGDADDITYTKQFNVGFSPLPILQQVSDEKQLDSNWKNRILMKEHVIPLVQKKFGLVLSRIYKNDELEYRKAELMQKNDELEYRKAELMQKNDELEYRKAELMQKNDELEYAEK